MTDEPRDPAAPFRRAIFFPTPGGNTGDRLIAQGCLRLLRSHGIEATVADGSLVGAASGGDRDTVQAALSGFDGDIFFSGGGNLGIYPDNEAMRATVISAAGGASRFLVFPQSGVAIEPALVDERVTVWARDSVTHQMLLDGGVRTALVPDAALLTADDFDPVPEGTGTMWILREPGRDAEQVNHSVTVDGDAADLTFDLPLSAIVDRLRPYRWIVSDRLHGGLIGLLMGKRVAFLPVGYYKTRAFYDTWLHNDPGVAFIESDGELERFRDADQPPTREIAVRAHSIAESELQRLFDMTLLSRPSRPRSPVGGQGSYGETVVGAPEAIDDGAGAILPVTHLSEQAGEVIVGLPELVEGGEGLARLRATIRSGDDSQTVWFLVPEDSAPEKPPSEPFALAALLHAMRLGRRLVIEGPVSPRLLDNFEGLQEIYAGWFPDLFARVSVIAEPSIPSERVSPVVAACFSGGVDSFHTVITRRKHLDALLYVDGLDMVDPDPTFRRMVRARVSEAADEVGLPLLVAATNVREYATPFAAWAEHFHAIALAAVGHAMSGGLGELLIPADRSFSTAIQWGNHPMTAPLHSSEAVRFTPSGWEGTRAERVIAIASYPPAMRHLRVCWRNPDSAYNCGKCEKCMRTKIGLDLAGGLDACATLDHELDLADYAAIGVDPGNLSHVISHLAAARRLGRHDIADVLQRMLDEHRQTDHTATASTALTQLTASGDDGAQFVAAHRETLYRTLAAHHGRWLTVMVLRSLPRRALGVLRERFRSLTRWVFRR